MGQPDKASAYEWTNASKKTDADTLRVLAVGSSHAANTNQATSSLPGARFVDFDSLTREVMDLHQPDVVLSPLMSSDFDCVEVAHRLVSNGFGGRYRAFAEDIPRPDLVRREICRSFPGLDFDLLVVTPGQEAQTV
ncbi:MAG: hypothetical protein VX874_01355 [Pseudomonadota bacterium]|nr:hypothetical protein [Pseudomonadota bacterium]